MNTFLHTFRLCLGLLLLSGLMGIAQAQDMGEVIRSQNMPLYPAGTRIPMQAEINTGARQKIAIRTAQGDVLIAGQNANIKLVKPGFFSHFFGKIYYFISPRQANEVSITTSTATIGIRGTKFIIDSADNDQLQDRVSLVEGRLNFVSNDDAQFEHYQQRELNEFELYKRQQIAEFAEYKQHMIEEFVAYKASIDLDAGYELVFDGKKVTQRPLAEERMSEIEEFEQFIAAN